jgi:hypothetical protein
MQPPTFHNLNVFGCLFYASTLTNARTTFDPPAIKCMFLGFKLGTKVSLLFDLHTRNTFIFRNVIVYEPTFPYYDNSSSPSVSTPDISYESTLFLDFPVQHHRPNSDHDGTLHNSQIDHNETSITIASDPTDDVVHDKHTEPDEIILRKSSRVSKPPGYLKDFHCNMATTTGNTLFIVYLLFCLTIIFLLHIQNLFLLSQVTLNPLLINKLLSMIVGSRP